MAKKNKVIMLGVGDVKKSLGILSRVPQAAVNGASKKGMRIPFYEARNSINKVTGNMKKGLEIYKEKKVKKAKAVYQIRYKASMTDIFRSESKSGKKAYYPASQEYGFKTRNGGYVEGRNHLKKAMTDNYKKIIDTINNEMLKRIDKAIDRAMKRKARSKD